MIICGGGSFSASAVKPRRSLNRMRVAERVVEDARGDLRADEAAELAADDFALAQALAHAVDVQGQAPQLVIAEHGRRLAVDAACDACHRALELVERFADLTRGEHRGEPAGGERRQQVEEDHVLGRQALHAAQRREGREVHDDDQRRQDREHGEREPEARHQVPIELAFTRRRSRPALAEPAAREPRAVVRGEGLLEREVGGLNPFLLCVRARLLRRREDVEQ
ncbi:MAG: hypothetical protein P8Y76_09545, partial [bacterium]